MVKNYFLRLGSEALFTIVTALYLMLDTLWMNTLSKTPGSEAVIRLPDRDPFNPLFNLRFLNCFSNARQDYLMIYSSMRV